MSSRFPADVEEILRRAGWFEGRRVDVAPFEARGGVMFPAARAILCEFGGLHIGENGPGVDFAKGEVDLRVERFVQASEVAKLGRTLGVRLYQVAVVGTGRSDAFVDEQGRVYEVHQDPVRVDLTSFDAVLASWLAGRGPLPFTWL